MSYFRGDEHWLPGSDAALGSLQHRLARSFGKQVLRMQNVHGWFAETGAVRQNVSDIMSLPDEVLLPGNDTATPFQDIHLLISRSGSQLMLGFSVSGDAEDEQGQGTTPLLRRVGYPVSSPGDDILERWERCNRTRQRLAESYGEGVSQLWQTEGYHFSASDIEHNVQRILDLPDIDASYDNGLRPLSDMVDLRIEPRIRGTVREPFLAFDVDRASDDGSGRVAVWLNRGRRVWTWRAQLSEEYRSQCVTLLRATASNGESNKRFELAEELCEDDLGKLSLTPISASTDTTNGVLGDYVIWPELYGNRRALRWGVLCPRLYHRDDDTDLSFHPHTEASQTSTPIQPIFGRPFPISANPVSVTDEDDWRAFPSTDRYD